MSGLINLCGWQEIDFDPRNQQPKPPRILLSCFQVWTTCLRYDAEKNLSTRFGDFCNLIANSFKLRPLHISFYP